MTRIFTPRLTPREGLREITPRLLVEWPLPPAEAVSRPSNLRRTLVVAGSALMPGAAILSAVSALRAGAGPLSIATGRSVAPTVALAVPEGRILGLRETPRGGLTRLPPGAASWDFDTVLVGPGMQDDDTTARLVQGVRARYPRAPLQLAAGAIHAMENETVPWDRFAAGPVLITADAVELAQLTGLSEAQVLADGPRAAAKAARHWRVVVLLKSPVAHVATPDGRVWTQLAAGAALALPGAADVLSGVVTGLIARGCTLEQAAVWGLALQTRAFDVLAERLGPVGGLARELADCVPGVMHTLASREARASD
ncbi:MAG: ADP/ATP-dependent (S)-NAD(P)H-hydrate dehydratase [Gammaproteobacteria bacterium]